MTTAPRPVVCAALARATQAAGCALVVAAASATAVQYLQHQCTKRQPAQWHPNHGCIEPKPTAGKN